MQNPVLNVGDWFSVKQIIRCPQDGSYRGDLFRVDFIEGDFAVCRCFSACGGHGRKHSMHLPDYQLQKLSAEYVLNARPELAEASKQPA